MARIRFTAQERPALLARAVLAENRKGIPTALTALAKALDEGEGKEFDDLLVAHYAGLALEAAGLAPAPAENEGESDAS